MSDSGKNVAFDLLESKLAVPALRQGSVRRADLVRKLCASTDAHVVSVTAPAGYGKTTLLAQWADEDSRPFAWVSLEGRDNDPAALLTYIAAALDRIHPIGPAAFRAAAGAGGSMWSSAVPQLGAALASLPEPVVLVLDDIHELTNPDCLDALELLGKHVQPGSQLVFSGRAESGARLPRARAGGQLLEIASKELALSDPEARALLDAAGARLSKDDAHELNERAEGWAAGLYLAALFLRDAGEGATVESFVGSDRFVVDYLRSEHLSRLKPAEVRFLTRTAILDRMSGPLCDHVLERTDSARRLRRLEDTNFFVVPLDHQREWYRYHHLFRQMLRAELERVEPELATSLHGRAAAWCERHGLEEAAIEHARAAGETGEVARLVTANTLPYYRSGRVVTVERWLSWFDNPEVIADYPAIAAFGAWVNALRGRPDEADRYAYALEHSAWEGPMPDRSASTRSWAAVSRALLCHHGVEQMASDAQLAADELSPSSFWRPMALILQGVAALLLDDLDTAEDLLANAAGDAVGSGAVWAGLVAHAELALLALGRGDQEQAERQVALAQALLDLQPVEDYVPSALLLAARARIVLASGQAATARELLVGAMRFRPQLTRAIPWFSVQTRLELARVHVAVADVAGARTLLREIDDILRQRPDLGTLPKQAWELRAALASVASVEEGWASTLTAAELRLLPLLTTHLSFREIAERLFVSRNTVKSQAISVYRKLGASSRSEAIERAAQLGLVDAPAVPSGGFTRTG